MPLEKFKECDSYCMTLIIGRFLPPCFLFTIRSNVVLPLQWKLTGRYAGLQSNYNYVTTFNRYLNR